MADGKTPYVIRSLSPNPAEPKDIIACFEEGVLGYNPSSGTELGVCTRDLIELLPPEETVKEIENTETAVS